MGKRWSSVFTGYPFGLMHWKGEFYFFFSTNQSKGIMLLINQHVEYKKKMVKTDLRIEWLFFKLLNSTLFSYIGL